MVKCAGTEIQIARYSLLSFVILLLLFGANVSFAQKNIQPRLIFETEHKLPRISPDGRFFSFIDRTTRHPALYDRLTGNSHDINANLVWGGRSLSTGQSIWSPDSKYVIFYWVENGISSLKQLDIKTGVHRDLTNANGDPIQAWPVDHSPDGKHLLGIFGPEKTAYFGLIPIAGGHLDTLDFTGHAFKSISPDGSNILYDSRTEDYDHEISIYSLAKRKSALLISSSRPEHIMTWIDDSSFVYAVVGEATNEIWKAELNDELQVISREKWSDQMRGWYPVGKTNDQKYCYFSREGWSDVFYQNIDLQELQFEEAQYQTTIYDNIRIRPRWSPQGDLMIYAGVYPSKPADFAIERRNTTTGEKGTLKVPLPDHLNPDKGRIIATPDGSKLIISVFNESSRTRDCMLVEKSDGQISGVVKNCLFPNINLNHQVFFVSGTHIVRFDLLDDHMDTLFSSDQRISQLNISNDGRMLAFYQGPHGQYGLTSLTVLNCFEKNYRTVVELDSRSQFTLSSKPNWFQGDTVLLASISDNPMTLQQLILIDIRSNAVHKLEKPLEVGNGIMQHIDLHPTQSKITYSIISDITKVWEVDLK